MKMKKRGFTLVELMVVVAIIALLMGLLLPALSSAMATARAKKDATNLRGMGQGLASYAGDYNGDWCIPGELWRNPVFVEGQGNVCMIGQGDPNWAYNHSGGLFSAMIAQRYWTVDIAHSPCEVNPDVGPKGEIAENGQIVAYDYSAWDPSNCSYWDTNFRCDLRNLNDKKSHSSYANNTLLGDRLRTWHETASSSKAVLSLRGTENGAMKDLEEGSGEYTRSPVLDFMGPAGAYHANMLWGDISIENIQNFHPGNSRYEERTSGYSNGLKKDNIFAHEFAGSPDANGNPSSWNSGDNCLTYSYLVGNPNYPNCLATWDELKD